MTTFDVAEVRRFAADLDDRLRRCDNGEGMLCATLDAALRHYADVCCSFRDTLRQWGQAIFAGRVALDPDVEREWKEHLARLYSRGSELLVYAQKNEGPCYDLPGQAALRAALWDLYRLCNPWVTPKRASGPSARQGLPLNPPAAEEARRRLKELPPLPADWRPDEARQQQWYRFLRASS